jgi:hypothetical protein
MVFSCIWLAHRSGAELLDCDWIGGLKVLDWNEPNKTTTPIAFRMREEY